MNILIVGLGKVGRNIAEELAQEEHNIVLVDSNEEVVSDISTSLDVLGVIGDGASLTTLKEAGVEKADILLSVTSSDEVNMLCCLFARKANPNIKTIARVRNPVYSKEIKYIKDELGLTLIINPEMAAAREIARLLRFPAAMKVEHFSHGQVELVSFEVPKDNFLVNKIVMDVSKIFKFQVLFVGIERNEEVIIAHGNTEIKEGDKLSVIAKPQDMTNFFSYIGLLLNPIKSVMIVGGSNIAYYLSQILNSTMNIRIIEKDKKICEELVEQLPNVTIINGDATDNNLLIEEGIKDVDAFVSLTGEDEQNIMLSLYAEKTTNAKVITKANRLTFDSVLNELEIGSLVYPKHITADNILTFVRGLSEASSSSNITTLYRIMDNKCEALSFKIKKESKLTGKALKDLNIIDNLLICSIIRNDNVFIPTGKDSIEVGDVVLLATTNKGLDDIEEILK